MSLAGKSLSCWEHSILIISADRPDWVKRTLDDIREVSPNSCFVTVRPHQSENRAGEYKSHAKKIGLQNVTVDRKRSLGNEFSRHRLIVTYGSSVFLEALAAKRLVIEYAFNEIIKNQSSVLHYPNSAGARELVIDSKEKFQDLVKSL